jgi:hypothetical protein
MTQPAVRSAGTESDDREYGGDDGIDMTTPLHANAGHLRRRAEAARRAAAEAERSRKNQPTTCMAAECMAEGGRAWKRALEAAADRGLDAARVVLGKDDGQIDMEALRELLLPEFEAYDAGAAFTLQLVSKTSDIVLFCMF